VETDVVILAAGRIPPPPGSAWKLPGSGLIAAVPSPVDKHCRAVAGVWAVGDVTGVALFTHVAKYQGRVVADNILGRECAASYHGIPRVVFADPEIATAGYTTAQARDLGIEVAAAEIALADAIARPWTYERDPQGTPGLLADTERRILVGAWAVAPLAGEWIHQAALAIRARIPIPTLLDQVAQYPSYSEAYLAALEQLAL